MSIVPYIQTFSLIKYSETITARYRITSVKLNLSTSDNEKVRSVGLKWGIRHERSDEFRNYISLILEAARCSSKNLLKNFIFALHTKYV